MTRFELLHLLVAQARANGFEFRKWYIAKIGLPWETTRQAVETLCKHRQYYALLFSHEFASSFWKAGERITFQVPTQTFTRRKPDGTIGTVSRKGYTRRSARDDAWLYHLRELATAMGARHPNLLGDALLLLIEGIYVTGQQSEDGPAQSALAAAKLLIDASVKAG